MFISFVATILLIFCIFGFSFLLKIYFYYPKTTQLYNIDFIYGFFLLILLGSFFNFFIPLQAISIIVFSIGILSSIYFFFKGGIQTNLISLLVIVIFLIFISHHQSIAYDSQLYHLQTLKYNTNHKVIFGLANLEPRYGMNSSWHTLISLLSIEYKRFNLLYLFNLSLYALFINEVFLTFLSKKKSVSNYFLQAASIYIFAYSFFHPYGNGTILNNLGSPEVDTVAMLLFILCAYLFLKFKENHDANLINLIFLLVFVTITTKLSYVGVFFIGLYLIYLNKEILKNLKLTVIIFISSSLWLLKSFFLTGCLLFPIKTTCFKTTWSLGIDSIEGYGNIIRSFARDTPDRLRFGDFNYTLHSFDWIGPWFKTYFLQTEFLTISFLIFIFNILVIFIFYKKNLFNKKYFLIILSIFFINLIIWFQAPEIRFGYGIIISLVSFTIAFVLFNINLKILNYRFVFIIFLIFCILLVEKNIKNLNIVNNLFQRNFDYSNYKILYETNRFKVYKPADGLFCNSFSGFCSYQSFKVIIEEKKNYLFIIKDTRS
jgi:hypothetical protein